MARPDKFVAELKEVGIHLDITVAVVDAESLDQILHMDIVKKQLQQVDLVLLNKYAFLNTHLSHATRIMINHKKYHISV